MQIATFILLSLFPFIGWARKIPDINWISSNPIYNPLRLPPPLLKEWISSDNAYSAKVMIRSEHDFDVSNTDHVISVHIGDRVSIRCPKSDETGKYEYSYIYMVSDEEYDHCFLSKPRLVGACDNQTINASINIVFRSFTPTPGGFEFQPGKNYFLISTSDGTLEGIDRKKDGLCTAKQMKIKFEVGQDRRGIENPKFAARTLKKDRDAEHSTPVMYVVHDESDIDDDDDGSNACSYFVSIVVLLASRYLL